MVYKFIFNIWIVPFRPDLCIWFPYIILKKKYIYFMSTQHWCKKNDSTAATSNLKYGCLGATIKCTGLHVVVVIFVWFLFLSMYCVCCKKTIVLPLWPFVFPLFLHFFLPCFVFFWIFWFVSVWSPCCFCFWFCVVCCFCSDIFVCVLICSMFLFGFCFVCVWLLFSDWFWFYRCVCSTGLCVKHQLNTFCW